MVVSVMAPSHHPDAPLLTWKYVKLVVGSSPSTIENAHVRSTRTPISFRRWNAASYCDSWTSWGIQYAFIPAKRYGRPSSQNSVPRAVTKPAGGVVGGVVAWVDGMPAPTGRSGTRAAFESPIADC